MAMTVPFSDEVIVARSFSTGSFDEKLLNFDANRIPFSSGAETVVRVLATQEPKKRSTLLVGSEPCHFDVEVEEQGVLDIIAALTEDEKKEMRDLTMPIRHFRAENGHLEKAIASIRSTLQWRKHFGVDRIVRANYCSHDPEMCAILEEESGTGILYARGYDVDGRCLLIAHLRAPKTLKQDSQMKHLVFVLEKAIACTKRKSAELNGGAPLEKFIVVCDFAGFKLSNSGPVSTSQLTLEIFQKHYPERLHRAYVINAPLVFRVFWAIIKPFINASNRQKIVFCSGEEAVFDKFVKIVERPDKLEADFSGGVETEARDFDAIEYLKLPFDVTFDE